MSPGRLNALTDGVIAIVLTIMVLELKFPAQPTLAAALAVMPLLAAYLLAFVNVAIFWNNHHHMMKSAHKVTGAVLWSNHALLFCLTLFPLMIRWIDEATCLAVVAIRRDLAQRGLRASEARLQALIEHTPNVELLCNTTVRKMGGNGHLDSVEIVNGKTKETRTVETPAVRKAAPR